MSMAPPAPNVFIPPGIGAIAGPLVLGYLFNYGLWGILTVQIYIYYLAFPYDSMATKVLVFVIFIFESLQTLLLTHDAFGAFGAGWGNPEALSNVQWLGLTIPIMSGIMSCTVQMFFAWRIYKISSKFYISIPIVLLALAECVAAIVDGVQTFQVGSLALLQNKAFVADSIWLGGSALCDVIITVTMTYYLWRSNTGFGSTNVFLTRLIRLTIETGMITSIVAIIDLLLFQILREANYHITPAFMLSKLYSNSLMVILNSRIRINNGREESLMTLNNASARNGLVPKESSGTLSHSRQGSNPERVAIEVNKSWQVRGDTVTLQTSTLASEVKLGEETFTSSSPAINVVEKEQHRSIRAYDAV